MNVINILLGLTIVISGILGLYAFTAPSQAGWLRRILIWFVAVIISGTCYIICIIIDLIYYSLGLGVIDSVGLYTLSLIFFALYWPQIIAFFINRKAIINPISVSKINYPLLGIALVVAFVLFAMTFMCIFLSTIVSLSEGLSIIDPQFIMQILMVVIPGAVLVILLPFRTIVVFHRNGIFCMGLLWAWSDFEDYRWKKDRTKKEGFILLLKTKRVWVQKQLSFKIASEQKEPIDNLLAEKLLPGEG